MESCPSETSTSTISAAYPSVGSESVDSPGRVVFVQEDVGHYVAPNLPEFDETLTPLPESARKENTFAMTQAFKEGAGRWNFRSHSEEILIP